MEADEDRMPASGLAAAIDALLAALLTPTLAAPFRGWRRRSRPASPGMGGSSRTAVQAGRLDLHADGDPAADPARRRGRDRRPDPDRKPRTGQQRSLILSLRNRLASRTLEQRRVGR